MDWVTFEARQIAGIGVCALALALSAVSVRAEETDAREPRRPRLWINQAQFDASPDQRTTSARLVQRRARLLEARQLRDLEQYYDDLEDFYNDRDDEQMAEYYEGFEKYYEDVRKGRRPYLPPEALAVQFGEPVPREGAILPRFIARRPPPQADLEQSYRQLRTQLTRFNTADTWLRYLALPLNSEGIGTPLSSLQTAEAREQLAAAVEHYDRVAADREFSMIARLPAFDRTRSALRSFNRWLEQQPTVEQSAEALVGEEIPVPAPVEDEPPAEGPLLVPQPQQ
jgi:hypothetical protein